MRTYRVKSVIWSVKDTSSTITAVKHLEIFFLNRPIIPPRVRNVFWVTNYYNFPGKLWLQQSANLSKVFLSSISAATKLGEKCFMLHSVSLYHCLCLSLSLSLSLSIFWSLSLSLSRSLSPYVSLYHRSQFSSVYIYIYINTMQKNYYYNYARIYDSSSMINLQAT